MSPTVIQAAIGGRPIQADSISKDQENGTITRDIPREDPLLGISTQNFLWKLDTRSASSYPVMRFHNTKQVGRILPLFVLLVLCSFLDRTNVGNAKLYHLEADLGMTNAQYNQALTAFYPLYIAGYVP